MSMMQLAMMGKLSYTVLHDAVFAYPTLADSLNDLFLHFVSQAMPLRVAGSGIGVLLGDEHKIANSPLRGRK